MIIRNLTVKYDNFTALDNLSLTIPERRITCILGESGIGKTTLLKAIMGLVQPIRGELIGFPEKKAAVFQENRLFEEFSAVRNIQIAGRHKLSEQEILNALAEVNVVENIHEPVAKLSGGMARRCAIVRALTTDAELILMDEPFKGLDEQNLCKTMSYIKRSRGDRSMIIVLHSLEQAKALTDQIFFLS